MITGTPVGSVGDRWPFGEHAEAEEKTANRDGEKNGQSPPRRSVSCKLGTIA
jgi:hypothetical protein